MFTSTMKKAATHPAGNSLQDAANSLLGLTAQGAADGCIFPEATTMSGTCGRLVGGSLHVPAVSPTAPFSVWQEKRRQS
jgi:hypothetical protein